MPDIGNQVFVMRLEKLTRRASRQLFASSLILSGFHSTSYRTSGKISIRQRFEKQRFEFDFRTQSLKSVARFIGVPLATAFATRFGRRAAASRLSVFTVRAIEKDGRACQIGLNKLVQNGYVNRDYTSIPLCWKM